MPPSSFHNAQSRVLRGFRWNGHRPYQKGHAPSGAAALGLRRSPATPNLGWHAKPPNPWSPMAPPLHQAIARASPDPRRSLPVAPLAQGQRCYGEAPARVRRGNGGRAAMPRGDKLTASNAGGPPRVQPRSPVRRASPSTVGGLPRWWYLLCSAVRNCRSLCLSRCSSSAEHGRRNCHGF
jgi:hypothetical protein